MTDTLQVGETDLFGRAELRRLVDAEGPCVSLFLPVHRAGPQTRQDPIRLRNLLDAARDRLVDRGLGPRAADELLAPERSLLDDGAFWKYQADGLALFASPSLHLSFRVPLDLAEDVSVADAFRLRPLLPLLTRDGRFFVLAISQNEVRLFQGTRTSMARLDRGGIPADLADALPYEDPEAELQFRSGGGQPGGEGAHYHGHEALDDSVVERFLRAVDHGLWDVLDEHDSPLVLACVARYVPLYRSITRHHRVLGQAVEGNPEGRHPNELHAAAWEIVAPLFGRAVDEARARYRDALGTGLTAVGAGDALEMALAGRVDTLFVVADGVGIEDGAESQAIDRAVIETLLTSGDVYAVSADELPDGGPVSVLLRY